MTLLAVTAYMVAQFAIAVWVSRRIRTESDYLLAGRKLGYVLATFSIFATWLGAETIVGSSGRAYRDGVSLGNPEPFAYALCLAIMGAVFAVPLWRRQLTTLADLYRQRYSVGTERFAAVILIPSSIVWAAAQIRAFSHVLASSSDALNGELAIAIAAGFCILYAAFGGMLVDAIVDVIQGIVLAVGLGIVFVAVLPHVGGVEAIGQAIADPARVHLMPKDTSMLQLLERWAVPVGGSVLATELVGRIFAAKSPEVARRAPFIATALYLGVGIIPLVIGLVGPNAIPSLADEELIISAIARACLPTFVYAVFAGSLIAAILSTVDSTLLVSSGILSHNLLVPALRVTDERRKVQLARAGVATFGVIAYFLARHATGILDLVEHASALGTAGILVTVSFGLFTNWGGPKTAMATLLAGLFVYLGATTLALDVPFLLALAASLVTYLLGALLERRLATSGT